MHHTPGAGSWCSLTRSGDPRAGPDSAMRLAFQIQHQTLQGFWGGRYQSKQRLSSGFRMPRHRRRVQITGPLPQQRLGPGVGADLAAGVTLTPRGADRGVGSGA